MFTQTENRMIIAISGFGGSGKTTFAALLSKEIDSPVVSIDSFNKRITEYSNWDLMDFKRFENEVLKSFKSGKNSFSYSHNDGENVSKDIQVNTKNVLIVEGVGIFQPDLMKYFDYSIWIDCPIDEAVKRGKTRDREVNQNPKDALWEGIWKRNDIEFFEKFRPDLLANEVVINI